MKETKIMNLKDPDSYLGALREVYEAGHFASIVPEELISWEYSDEVFETMVLLGQDITAHSYTQALFRVDPIKAIALAGKLQPVAAARRVQGELLAQIPWSAKKISAICQAFDLEAIPATDFDGHPDPQSYIRTRVGVDDPVEVVQACIDIWRMCHSFGAIDLDELTDIIEDGFGKISCREKHALLMIDYVSLNCHIVTMESCINLICRTPDGTFKLGDSAQQDLLKKLMASIDDNLLYEAEVYLDKHLPGWRKSEIGNAWLDAWALFAPDGPDFREFLSEWGSAKHAARHLALLVDSILKENMPAPEETSCLRDVRDHAYQVLENFLGKVLSKNLVGPGELSGGAYPNQERVDNTSTVADLVYVLVRCGAPNTALGLVNLFRGLSVLPSYQYAASTGNPEVFHTLRSTNKDMLPRLLLKAFELTGMIEDFRFFWNVERNTHGDRGYTPIPEGEILAAILRVIHRE